MCGAARLTYMGKRLLLAALLALFACTVDKYPPLPTGAVEFAPLDSYPAWWLEVEGCSGKTRDMTTVHWFAVPGIEFRYNNSYDLGGYMPHYAIIVADSQRMNAAIVRHEILHALRYDHNTHHDSLDFSVRCRSLVQQP